jgi:hypothetical protein
MTEWLPPESARARFDASASPERPLTFYPPGPAPAPQSSGPQARAGDWVGGVLLALFIPIVGVIAGIVYVCLGGERRSVGWLTICLSVIVFLAYLSVIGAGGGAGSGY